VRGVTHLFGSDGVVNVEVADEGKASAALRYHSDVLNLTECPEATLELLLRGAARDIAHVKAP
jgi:hypothetical protein